MIVGTIPSSKLSQTVHLDKSAAKTSFVSAGKPNSSYHAINGFCSNTDSGVRIKAISLNPTVQNLELRLNKPIFFLSETNTFPGFCAQLNRIVVKATSGNVVIIIGNGSELIVHPAQFKH